MWDKQNVAPGNTIGCEPTNTSKLPIRTRYLGHVTGYQPIRDVYYSPPKPTESGKTGPWLADNQSRDLNNEFLFVVGSCVLHTWSFRSVNPYGGLSGHSTKISPRCTLKIFFFLSNNPVL
eukprot:sb/3476139/